MSEIVLQATALKASIKGGGETTRTERHPGFLRLATRPKHHPSPYIVFICPACDARNKKVHHKALYQREEIFAFRCQCGRLVEVSPHGLIQRATA